MKRIFNYDEELGTIQLQTKHNEHDFSTYSILSSPSYPLHILRCTYNGMDFSKQTSAYFCPVEENLKSENYFAHSSEPFYGCFIRIQNFDDYIFYCLRLRKAGIMNFQQFNSRYRGKYKMPEIDSIDITSSDINSENHRASGLLFTKLGISGFEIAY